MLFAKWQRGVLMPSDEPIGVRRFVEESRAEREGIGAKNRLSDPEQVRIGCDLGDGGMAQQVANASAAARVRFRILQADKQLLDFMRSQYIRENRISILLDLRFFDHPITRDQQI